MAIPIGSMYGIYTYIWLIFMVNVGKNIPVPWILWDILSHFATFSKAHHFGYRIQPFVDSWIDRFAGAKKKGNFFQQIKTPQRSPKKYDIIDLQETQFLVEFFCFLGLKKKHPFQAGNISRSTKWTNCLKGLRTSCKKSTPSIHLNQPL